MEKYRKKPVVVRAIRFHGDNAADVARALIAAGCERQVEVAENATCLHIHTLEGTMRANPGDFIIGVQGEPYPCKPDIFEATYERVEE